MGAEGEIDRLRWNVDDYHRMVEVGLLSAGDRTELIDGEIVRMAPIGPPHASVVARLTKALVSIVGEVAPQIRTAR